MCQVTKARERLRTAPHGQIAKRRRDLIRAVARSMADSMDREGVRPPKWVLMMQGGG